MSEYLSEVHGSPSGLTDRERSLLCYLAVRTIASQTGADEQTAADALDQLAAEGRVAISGDRHDIYLVAAGNSIVHAARDWLRYMAYGRGGVPSSN